MADKNEDNSRTRRLLEDNNALICSECPENISSSNKANTVIIRCSDNVNQPYIRMCTTCFKRIDRGYYFLWEFLEFCNILCISKFQGLNFKCMHCSHFINNTLFGKFYIRILKTFKFFCSTSCMEHYKLKNRNCSYCQDLVGNFMTSSNSFAIGTDNISFCSEVCCKMFNDILKPKVAESAICSVCNQNKSITITLKHDGATKYFCAKRCLIAYSFVKLQTGTEQCTMCQNYFSKTVVEKYTVHYEYVALIFCSTTCQNIYMLLNGKFVNCRWCQNKRSSISMIRKCSYTSPQNLYICCVNCFKLYECSTSAGIPQITTLPPGNQVVGNTFVLSTNSSENSNINNLCYPSLAENKQIVVHAKKSVDQRNVATMCFIPKEHKDISVQPDLSNKVIQTDKADLREIVLPIPVPIYIPTPMAMYAIPIPTAVPFLLPVPVPVFVPISKQSVTSLMEEIQVTCNRIPSDPCEAELLKIADIIAGDNTCDSHTHTFDEDHVSHGKMELKEEIEMEHNGPQFEGFIKQLTNSKRLCEFTDSCETGNKRKCLTIDHQSNINLNYTLGINALQQWTTMNKDYISQTLFRNDIPKTDILQMLPDELNLTLDLFIKELKKPDGSEYAPDTLYYLCLGIQYYLCENGRVDNIFLDKTYDRFSNTLNKFSEKFNSLYLLESHVIITRVEEEHLWETRQLGCYSPHVLLNTLVFFNTKYYHCSTLEHHLDISFFQILKLWKKRAKSKSLMLRFHPRKLKDGSKRVYEQYPNDADQTRCPVKLYEFYLSKCPESVKTSNCMFYLQPEQYCISDSPLWYMNSSLEKETLAKMINRVKMVKEINIALIT